jgi:hypothetical protein
MAVAGCAWVGRLGTVPGRRPACAKLAGTVPWHDVLASPCSMRTRVRERSLYTAHRTTGRTGHFYRDEMAPAVPLSIRSSAGLRRAVEQVGAQD